MKSSFKTFNKKIISLALVAVMLICAVPFSTSIDYSSWFTVEASAIDYEVYKDACDTIVNSLDAISDTTEFLTDDDGAEYYEIKLTSFNIPLDNRADLQSALSWYYPVEYSIIDIYTMQFWSTLNINTSETILYSVRLIEDKFDFDEFDEKTETLQTVVDELLTYVDDMSDFETIVFFHDYLILNAYYDTSLNIFDAYFILVENYGVCQAYAYAYKLLLNSAGIDCLYVSSTSMNHGWNLVELDGQWYHVDITWDDPSDSDIEITQDTSIVGRLDRTYFLLNDDEITENAHYDWTVDYESTSTTYSDMPRSTNIIQTYANDSWYYYSNGSLYSCDQYGDNEKLLSSTMGNGLAVYGDYYYYGVGETIVAQSISDATTETIYTLPDETDNSYQFFTLFVQGDELYYYYDLSSNIKYISTDYSNSNRLLSITALEGEESISLASTEVHVHEYTEEYTEPTCSEYGYTTYSCSCGSTYTVTDTETALKAHSYTASSTVINPTCAEDGYTLNYCSCGAYEKTDIITASGHSYTASSTVINPTCTEDGYTLNYCSCGAYEKIDIITSSGHSYTAVETPATCTAAGRITYTC
ncbi:MAG: hypothetical protein R3Y27_06210, partial [Clostridia bacterium]